MHQCKLLNYFFGTVQEPSGFYNFCYIPYGANNLNNNSCHKNGQNANATDIAGSRIQVFDNYFEL